MIRHKNVAFNVDGEGQVWPGMLENQAERPRTIFSRPRTFWFKVRLPGATGARREPTHGGAVALKIHRPGRVSLAASALVPGGTRRAHRDSENSCKCIK